MAPATSGQVRILVVDDEPDIAESFAELVRSFLPDAVVDQALGGEEALRKLHQHRVDLIVTDFKMPGMNGVEFLREVERFAPGTPNILVTAFGAEAVNDAGKPEPDLILQKPFDIMKFQGAVEHALASG